MSPTPQNYDRGMVYWPHLKTNARTQIQQAAAFSDADVFQFRRGIFKDQAFFENGTYATIDKKGNAQFTPYLNAPFAEAADLALTPFTLRSLAARPIAWAHQKLRPDAYKPVNFEELGRELDQHGGVVFLQVISPPRAGRTDYIKCADGTRYVLDKKNARVLRL